VQLGGERGFEFFGSNLRSAASVMQRLALETTRCEKPWFHTQTRLAPGERLNFAQWEQTLDREEKRLGFADLPRAWSFHIDEATREMHMHAARFRVDTETGLARDPGLFKLRLMEVARACELEFGLREVGNTRQAHDRARAAERNEQEESRRLGTDVPRSARPFSIASNMPTAARHSVPRSRSAACSRRPTALCRPRRASTSTRRSPRHRASPSHWRSTEIETPLIAPGWIASQMPASLTTPTPN
jgi:hypothetical protein